MFELVKILGDYYKKELIISNIKVGFRSFGIWPLNYDDLLHDMACSSAFKGVDVVEYAYVMENILSLS